MLRGWRERAVSVRGTAPNRTTRSSVRPGAAFLLMQNQRPRLLVVDDDRAILTLIGTIALAEGFDVATTVSGEDAMTQLAHRPADLVLLDLRMPGVTGLDVLRAIREIIMERGYQRIMFILTDDVLVEGVFKTDGYVDIRRFGAKQVAEFICQRLDILIQR